ncbi:MAG: KH domain-containing protein [Clostridia bacterium]|nr:KH domain-containing protein [Clostridia bacterium]
MLDVNKLLSDIAKAIVDNPDDVRVIQSENDNTILLTLKVSEGDVGMVIGKHGRIAKAIRSLMKSASTIIGKKIIVEIE